MASTQDSLGLGEQHGIGLRSGVGVAGQGQGPVIVGQGDAERSHGVEVPDLVGADQQVPGDLALPGRSIDKIGCTAEGGDLSQNPVYGGLQRVTCNAVSSAPVA